jgi:hypothetical protein
MTARHTLCCPPPLLPGGVGAVWWATGPGRQHVPWSPGVLHAVPVLTQLCIPGEGGVGGGSLCVERRGEAGMYSLPEACITLCSVHNGNGLCTSFQLLNTRDTVSLTVLHHHVRVPAPVCPEPG